MNDGLFREPEHLPHALSRTTAEGSYRARKGRPAKWTKYAGKLDCEECGALQHEGYHPGAPLPRLRVQATARRAILGGPDLLLCGPHRTLWLERDAQDMESR